MDEKHLKPLFILPVDLVKSNVYMFCRQFFSSVTRMSSFKQTTVNTLRNIIDEQKTVNINVALFFLSLVPVLDNLNVTFLFSAPEKCYDTYGLIYILSWFH